MQTEFENDVVEGQEEIFGNVSMRWFQVAGRNATVQSILKGSKRILIVQPTGTGKTNTIGFTLDSSSFREAIKLKRKQLRVLFFATTQRLLTQAKRVYDETIENADIKYCTPFSNITADDFKWADVIVFDEAHHEAMMSFQYQLEKVKTNAIVIGATATEDRLDGMLLKFDRTVELISREQAVEEGFIAETDLYSIISTGYDGYVQLIIDTINNFHHIMGNTIIFVRTKEEIRQICDYLSTTEFSYVGLIDQTQKQVDKLMDEFSAGQYKFVVNCTKIGEGVDVRGCTSVILGKKYNSYSQLNQNIGRACRPDSDCVVFEFVDICGSMVLDVTNVVGTPRSHTIVYDIGDSWEYVELELQDEELLDVEQAA